MAVLGTALLAIIPPVFFMAWILRYDRIEPEPFPAVIKILILGCFTIIPAAFLENVMLAFPAFQGTGLVAAALQSFLVISPVEEAVKFLLVILVAWRSRHFSERNDGIVYAGAASIGFALAENLFYVFEHGAGVGIARALTSIPGHTFTGVIMGYHLGRARFAETSSERIRGLFLGFLVPWFLHGLYDTMVLSGTAAAFLVIPLVVLNFVVGIRLLKKGRDSSALRWQEALPEPKAETRRGGGCRKAAGITLLVLSGLFWVLIMLGLLFGDTEGYSIPEVLTGSVLLSFLPIAVGTVLLVSRRKHQGRDSSRS